MNGYYELVAKQLKEHSYSLLRQTVSTNYYSRHTANGIMRQAGFDHRF